MKIRKTACAALALALVLPLVPVKGQGTNNFLTPTVSYAKEKSFSTDCLVSTISNLGTVAIEMKLHDGSTIKGQIKMTHDNREDAVKRFLSTYGFRLTGFEKLPPQYPGQED